MTAISLSTAEPIIERLMLCNLPIMLWGPIGVGKSSIVHKIGKNQNRNVIIIILSQIEYSDLRGIPYIANEVMKWSTPSFLPKTEDDNSILFFDELNLANQSILSAAYQIILDRKIGDYVLPKNCSIIAAGNRLEDNSEIIELPMPLLNRFVHIEVGYDITSWLEYAKNNNIHKSIIDFLSLHKNELAYKTEQQIKYAYNTPRSWSYVSKILHHSTIKKDSVLKNSIMSCVGESIGRKFYEFLTITTESNLDINKIIEDETYKVDKKITLDDITFIKNNSYLVLEQKYTTEVLKDLKNNDLKTYKNVCQSIDNILNFVYNNSTCDNVIAIMYFFKKEKAINFNTVYMPHLTKIVQNDDAKEILDLV